jgi:hypothetical protein
MSPASLQVEYTVEVGGVTTFLREALPGGAGPPVRASNWTSGLPAAGTRKE